MRRKSSAAALAILIAAATLVACGVPATVSTPTMPTKTPRSTTGPTPLSSSTLLPTFTPLPTATVRPTSTPTPTALPTLTPTSTPIPGPVEGYWITSTTREGLCSDNPRLLGYDRSSCRAYIGDGDTTICYLGIRSLEMWPHDYPSPLVLFPTWISVDVPNLERVTAGTAFSNDPNPYVSIWGDPTCGMPSFAGSGGQCIVLPGDAGPGWQGGEPQWQCLTTADGLPFDDIRGYGIVQDSNVEWYMSADSVASKGLQPHDVFYLIPELVGVAEARPTWLGVPEKEEEGVWVGTNGYGVIHIDPLTGDIFPYTTADGLPGDNVRGIVSCGVQCAWAATDGGVGHWDGTRWRAYTTHDGLPSDDVLGISPTDCYWKYGLWAATAAGPARLAKGAETWQSFPDSPADVEVNGVLYSIFSTRGHGLIRFVEAPVAQGRVTHLTTADGLPSDRITALAATTRAEKARGILVGTPQGAVEGDGTAWAPITTAAVNDASSTTIATDAGLWVWDGGIWGQVTHERTLRVAEGGWYATPGQVCRWVDGAAICLTTPDGQPLSNVAVLYADSEAEIVVASDGHTRLWIYEAESDGPGHFVASATAFDLGQINDVIATPDVWHYATEAGIYHTPCDSHGCMTEGDFGLAYAWPISVRQMSLDKTTGAVWIATSQGGFYQEPMEWWGATYIAGLPHQDLTAVLALPDGSAWFGTDGAGLMHFEP